MAPHLLAARSDSNSTDGGFSHVYIAGVAIVGVLVAGVAIWLGIRTYKKRNKQRTASLDNQGGSFEEGKGTFDSEKYGSLPSTSEFSRDGLGGVVMPAPLKTKEEILSYHRQNGTLTHAFKLSVDSSTSNLPPSTPIRTSTRAMPSPLNPSPPTAAYNPRGRTTGTGPRPGSSLNPDRQRDGSRASFNAGFVLGGGTTIGERPISTISWQPPSSPAGSGFSFDQHSRNASGSSIASYLHGGGAAEKTVRQIFAPVLPDELVIALGDRLTVVQSLDDGWCVVGRENANPAATPKGAFGQGTQDAAVEMGVVPAWVFVKPVKGLRAERPMRTTSLGITVQVPAPMGAREEVMSWSNF